ncbi:MAG TPA: hypothetical protein VI456_12930 [Polyangia bacterium]
MARRRPSILIADFDAAVENHLVGKISDLRPSHADPEDDDDDRIESLRSDLHGAIARVLAAHGVRILASRGGTIARRAAGA